MSIIDQNVLSVMKTQSDKSVLSIANQKPIMLIFLRHFGCQFCREAMDDLSKLRPRLNALNTELILVHMAENKVAETYLKKFNLEDINHISDPDCRFYTAFGLKKGNFTQIFGIQSWIRGYSVRVKYGSEIGKYLGDNFQLPGAFVIFEGKILDSFINKYPSDRPNYDGLLDAISLN
jgi:peroxiredoxin